MLISCASSVDNPNDSKAVPACVATVTSFIVTSVDAQLSGRLLASVALNRTALSTSPVMV